ncbi:MAG: hypothetical protein DRN49_02320 [Thaumarchaeota archaeon]|nr:MAG: hypothetical protein DRN49_02320 [Nitrososphaerota archaeon]
MPVFNEDYLEQNFLKRKRKGTLVSLTIILLICIGFLVLHTIQPSNITHIEDLSNGAPPNEVIPSEVIPEGKESTEPPIVEPPPEDENPPIRVEGIDPQTGEYKNFYLGLVHDGAILAGSGCYGEFIVLINNKDAKNPTYSELLRFLEGDITDGFPYQYTIPVVGFYSPPAEDKIDLEFLKDIINGIDAPNPPEICADFAERLHNNSELEGIRCGYVSLELDGIRHACNAFETTDKGLIYIDDTGFLGGCGPDNNDTIVDIHIGEQYNPAFLFPSGGWHIPENSMGVVESVVIVWEGKWRDRNYG